MRDSWQSLGFFNNLIKEGTELFELQLSRNDCFNIARASYQILGNVRVSYAKGGLLSELKNLYSLFLKYIVLSKKCYEKTGEDDYPADLTIPRFVSSAIVYGECLGFDKPELKKMAECIPAGIDQLVDRLLAHYQPDREISDVLKEKGKYKQLIEILDSDDKDFQAKKLKNYLNQWPKKLGIRAPDGIRPLHETPTYDGYWCYEAAAVVIVADIDDESFKDHEFYPAELMSWRKG